MDSVQKNIYNTENYNDKLSKDSVNQVIETYIYLVENYIDYIYNNLSTKNSEYFSFIIIRGLDTINHIFNFLLIYTKNIELIIYHIQKAYLYYVEFVGQIGEETTNYIQLNSKDATLFVYKKTIFEINNDFRKKLILSDYEKGLYIRIKKYTDVYNTHITIMLKKTNDIINYETVKSSVKDMKNISKKLINNYFIYEFDTEIIDVFIKFIVNKYTTINKYIELYKYFVLKLIKKPINKSLLIKKLSNIKNDDYFTKKTSLKYINWLYSNSK
tara:strand:+ start:13455 stop:14267 length:813 start_codon:yes stop_codon:yes gene_type:complete